MDTKLLITNQLEALLQFKKLYEEGELSDSEFLELVQDLTDIKAIESQTDDVELLVKARAIFDTIKQLAGLIIQ